MIAAATAGALFGAGLLLLLSWARFRPSLIAQVRRVEGAGTAGSAAMFQRSQPVAVAGLSGRVDAFESVLRRHIGSLANRVTDASVRADLDLLGVEPQTHAARQALLGIGALVLTPLPLLAAATVLGVPWLAAGWVVLLAVAAAVMVPNLRVRSRAARLRRTFVTTLTSYLELVSMRVASGSGVAEALRDASHVGSGYGWRRLRDALSSARLSGDSPAVGLGHLGEDIAVPELTELASQLSLVEATGAQTEATLRAKAEALRERQRIELHGHANARSQTLVLGQILLAAAYMILIAYPALAAVMSL
ncbi:hypothetical protein [Aquipuribacter hungaricus]|uniref:Type II secretion system F family protein n=1 Tax=Aquipuribacter hungaricus TaxID=545624 RepID=A0ABV7WDJ7_9MICO